MSVREGELHRPKTEGPDFLRPLQYYPLIYYVVDILLTITLIVYMLSITNTVIKTRLPQKRE